MEGLGALGPLIPIILMVVIFYFMLIRPQKKRQQQIQQMQANLQKGDKIITIGGLHGVIHAMDENTIIIQSEDGTKLTYDRGAVREVTNQE